MLMKQQVLWNQKSLSELMMSRQMGVMKAKDIVKHKCICEKAMLVPTGVTVRESLDNEGHIY